MKRRIVRWMCPLNVATVTLAGCGPGKIDFSQIKAPPRSSDLDAYEVFVGSWDWEADMASAADPDRHWTGEAQWRWTLDGRCLHGTLSARSERANFSAEGLWSWHPKARHYVWTMFNNWGFPQQGTATYDSDTKSWTMNYTGVGLDGTTGYGRYSMSVVDDNTLEWSWQEWADGLHLVKKSEMKGTYKRRK